MAFLWGLLIFALCFYRAHSEEALPETAMIDAPNGTPASEAAPLESISPLWSRSMFTSRQVNKTPPTDSTLPPAWLANMQLCGWIRLDGILKVYVRLVSTDEILVLKSDEPMLPGVPRLLALEGEDTLLDGRVQLSLDNQVAWLTLQQNSHPQSPASTSSDPPAPTSTTPTLEPSKTVVEPTTIDSRAARLTSPVIMKASVRFEDMLSQPADGETVNTKQRLLDRREKLLRDFPRNTNP